MKNKTSKPYKKLTGRPPKDAEDKRSRKVSATFTEAKYSEIKNKAKAAGLTIAELLRVSVFRLTIVERLTEFEREAIREFMYQGKNLASMPAQPATSTELPGKIEVEFPPNIATDESVQTAIKKGLADQTLEIIKALNLRELPNMIRDTFKDILETAFKAGFDASILEALDEAMNKAMSKQVARLTASADSLYYKVQSIIDGHWWKVTPKWVWGIFLILVTAVIGLSIGCTHLYNENDKLREEEWVYRYFRTSFQDDDGQKYLINTERDFYRGTWQEQDSIKDYIRWREQHYGLDKTFLHFYPTEE